MPEPPNVMFDPDDDTVCAAPGCDALERDLVGVILFDHGYVGACATHAEALAELTGSHLLAWWPLRTWRTHGRAAYDRAQYPPQPGEIQAAFRAALEEIRGHEGKVCANYEVCQHPACASSYNAWQTASDVLKRFPSTDPNWVDPLERATSAWATRDQTLVSPWSHGFVTVPIDTPDVIAGPSWADRPRFRQESVTEEITVDQPISPTLTTSYGYDTTAGVYWLHHLDPAQRLDATHILTTVAACPICRATYHLPARSQVLVGTEPPAPSLDLAGKVFLDFSTWPPVAKTWDVHLGAWVPTP